LSDCNGRMHWPERGVYFFFEAGETQSETGNGPRVVRVGTHALISSSTTTLWNRLSQHRGTSAGTGGNHRGSIFRLLIGDAMTRHFPERFCPTWGRGSSATREVREGERDLETQVSAYIGAMPFLWLAALDGAGPLSLRGFIERNAIALLSNFNRPAIDPPSDDWLGKYSSRMHVRQSGLWNNNHVDEQYDPSFLDLMAKAARITREQHPADHRRSSTTCGS
jgi:hypothetical protein